MKHNAIEPYNPLLTGSDGQSDQDGDRRRNHRHQLAQHVGVVTRSGRLICDLLDLSSTGAKLSIVDGNIPRIDEPLILVLFDGTAVPALVKWVGRQRLGVTFVEDFADIEQYVDGDDVGLDYFRKAVRLQKSMSR